MAMEKLTRIGVVFVLVCGVLVLANVAFKGWYSIASNYDYDALAGAYIFNQFGEKCFLYLKSDRTFLEKLTRPGSVQEAHGTWNRYGESHMSFSSEFLTVSGEELNASGQAHGQFEKKVGAFPSPYAGSYPEWPYLSQEVAPLIDDVNRGLLWRGRSSGLQVRQLRLDKRSSRT